MAARYLAHSWVTTSCLRIGWTERCAKTKNFFAEFDDIAFQAGVFVLERFEDGGEVSDFGPAALDVVQEFAEFEELLFFGRLHVDGGLLMVDFGFLN